MNTKRKPGQFRRLNPQKTKMNCSSKYLPSGTNILFPQTGKNLYCIHELYINNENKKHRSLGINRRIELNKFITPGMDPDFKGKNLLFKRKVIDIKGKDFDNRIPDSDCERKFNCTRGVEPGINEMKSCSSELNTNTAGMKAYIGRTDFNIDKTPGDITGTSSDKRRMNTYTKGIVTYINETTSGIKKMNIGGKVSDTYSSGTDPGFKKSDKYFTTSENGVRSEFLRLP